MRKLLMICLGLLGVCLLSCSSDNDDPRVKAPRSLITEFVRPTSLFHAESDFNVNFVVDKETSKIVDMKILDFTIIPMGSTIDVSTDPVFFVEQLREIGDVNAPENLTAECSLYRPSMKPVRSIKIYAKLVSDKYSNPLNLHGEEDCSRYFGISYVSYYDFIRNGYSWKGIENPGPVYRQTLGEFNNSGAKKLVDTNGITFYFPEEIQSCVRSYAYTIKIEYTDGEVQNFSCRPVSDNAWSRLTTMIKRYNDGYLSELPDWNLLKSPRR